MYRSVTMMPLLLLLAVWSVGAAGAADCRDWQALRETPEGKLFHRCRPGSDRDEIMIETHLEAAPERLYALVNDYDAFAGFIPDVAESRVLARQGPVQWVYHRLRLPPPLADRAYILQSTAHVTPDAWRVVWRLSGREFPGGARDGAVRPDSLSGFWEILAAGDPSRSKARYALHVEPGGHLPGWLVRHMTERYVQRVVAAVRARLESE
jgi:hypothetical protein